MKYKDSIAKKLQTEKGLKDSTLARWKTKGSIPNQHFNTRNSTITIMGYTYREARELIGLNQVQVAEDLTNLEKSLAGVLAQPIQHTSISTWELGVVNPKKQKQELLRIYYESKFLEKGINPKQARCSEPQ